MMPVTNDDPDSGRSPNTDDLILGNKDQREKQLLDLSDLVMNLQRDVTRQEGEIIAMRKAISSCTTQAKAELDLRKLSTPQQLHDKVESVRTELLAQINGKATTNDLMAAISTKASRDDLARLNAHIDQFLAALRPVSKEDLLVESAATLQGDSQVTIASRSDPTEIDLLSDRLLMIEGIFDDVISNGDGSGESQVNAQAKNPTLTTKTASSSRQVDDLCSDVDMFKEVSTVLDDKVMQLSEVTADLQDRLNNATKSINTTTEAIRRMEGSMGTGACDDVELTYSQVHSKVEELSRSVKQSMTCMEEQMHHSRPMPASEVETRLDGFRTDLQRIQTNANEQMTMVADMMSQLSRADMARDKRLNLCQKDVSDEVKAAKVMALSNQDQLRVLTNPVFDDINAIKAENRIFFNELLRIEESFVRLHGDMERMIVMKEQHKGGRPMGVVPIIRSRQH